jgi:kinesin family protein 11
VKTSSLLRIQGNGLADLTDAYHKAASTGLSTVKDATRTVMEQGVQEDVPTGTTPRKRAFEFVDQWQLTKNREMILRASKEYPIPSSGNDENLLVPNESVEQEPPATDIEREASPDGADILRASSPLAVSSSVSSCSETPRPKPSQKSFRGALQKSGLPSAGTLTDRPTNIITHRRTRRVR